MPRLRHLVALVAVVAAIAVPRDGVARGCRQDALCRACFDSILLDASDTNPDCDDPQDLIDSRVEATQFVNERYRICASQAGGTGVQQPGSCRSIVHRLNDCARKRERASGRIWSEFKRRVRRRCGPEVLGGANQARRGCLRNENCLCDGAVVTTTTTTTTTTSSTVATTTTTTTTTTTSTTVATTTTTTLFSGGTTSTTTTTTTTTTSTTRGEPVPIEPTGSQCQLACIARVASDCFDDCDDNCGTAVNAIPLCQRTCRNHQCEELATRCTAPDDDFESLNPRDRNEDYYACCRLSGDCDLDDEESLSCRQPPEQPSATTTTIASGGTTTTLSDGGF